MDTTTVFTAAEKAAETLSAVTTAVVDAVTGSDTTTTAAVSTAVRTAVSDTGVLPPGSSTVGAAVALGTLLKLVLEVLRRRTPFLKGEKRHHAMIIATVVAAAAFAVDHITLGQSVYDAIVMAGGSYLAVLLDVLFPPPTNGAKN